MDVNLLLQAFEKGGVSLLALFVLFFVWRYQQATMKEREDEFLDVLRRNAAAMERQAAKCDETSSRTAEAIRTMQDNFVTLILAIKDNAPPRRGGRDA